MNKPLSPLFWLWIPLFYMGMQIIFEIFLSPRILAFMHAENGPLETLQAVLISMAFFVALYCFVKSSIAQTFLLRFWFALAAICCFYVAGEEVSWGQHIWDWSTPEFWSNVNDQQETNLHNTSSWLDQKPRLILLLGIVGGTIIAPLLRDKNILKLPAVLDNLLPHAKLRMTALLVIIPHLIEKIFEQFDVFLFTRFSEIQELYMFYFVLLYLLFLKQKLGAKKIS